MNNFYLLIITVIPTKRVVYALQNRFIPGSQLAASIFYEWKTSLIENFCDSINFVPRANIDPKLEKDLAKFKLIFPALL